MLSNDRGDNSSFRFAWISMLDLLRIRLKDTGRSSHQGHRLLNTVINGPAITP